MTEPRPTAPDRVVLVHGPDPRWRYAMQAALREMEVRVLVSSREAEAAKCLRDPQLVLAVAIDGPAIRQTFATLRASLPVIWSGERTPVEDLAEQVGRHLGGLPD